MSAKSAAPASYRAAEKALNGPDKTDRNPSLKDGVTLRHDHSWESCHKQKYFRRRMSLAWRGATLQSRF